MDIKTRLNDELMGSDWGLSGGQLDTDRGLETAIIISLFTDARARPDDPLPEGEPDRRGWWGDAVPPDAMPWETGSRLWLLRRAKETAETARRAEDYCTEALKWLVERRLAERVEVTAAWADRGRLELLITITRPGGVTAKYSHLWSAQK